MKSGQEYQHPDDLIFWVGGAGGGVQGGIATLIGALLPLFTTTQGICGFNIAFPMTINLLPASFPKLVLKRLV